MHGMGRGVRQMMLYAKPWQRYLLSGAIIAVGAVLVALGHARGAILIVLGALFLIETARHGFSIRRQASEPHSQD